MEIKRIDPVRAAEKVLYATDIRLVCYDRQDVTTDQSYLAHCKLIKSEIDAAFGFGVISILPDEEDTQLVANRSVKIPPEVLSLAYQQFIMLARNCKTGEFGADYQHMMNLIENEDELSDNNLSKYQKNLSDIKIFMITAIEEVLYRDISAEDKDCFKFYLEIIPKSTSSIALLIMCREGVEKLMKYPKA